MPIEDDLIWYLTWRVREEEGVPAKTRLVKLLYLIDLLNVRDRNEQATNLEWVWPLSRMRFSPRPCLPGGGSRA